MTDLKNKRRNALGRGLSALLSDSDGMEHNTPGQDTRQASDLGSVSEINIDLIEVNPYQPRTHFDLVALEELSQSIQVQGIIQPITVRRMGESYQLISGERRLQASKMAGLKTIPAYVRTADDEQMLEMALIENIQRQDLNPIEIAMAYQRLVEELNLRLEDLGDKVGKKRATVNNYMRLLKLPPEIQIGLREGAVGMGHARALITVERVEDQLAIYKAIIEQGMNVRQVEDMARQLAEKSQRPNSTKATPKKDIHLQKLERQLEQRLGSRVAIKQNQQGKGELKISFTSTDELNHILKVLDL